MAHRYAAGCDVGSTTGKAVILEENKIVATAIVPSELDPEETATIVLNKACQQVPALGGISDLSGLVGTGYGRNEIPFADENISEISCHALGVHFCDPSVRTIVDIGGQDVKGISLNPDGAVLDFVMNDKCAAGTGRFLEMMSRTFRMSLSEFSDISLKAQRVVPITAQCSVFAETEVISLLAKKTPPADIAAGIQAAVAKRSFILLKKVGIIPNVAVTGGCSKNKGLLQALGKKLRMPVTPLSVDPQLMGALGAAVAAQRKNAGQPVQTA
ncbi:putative CoA-substrate-specific enzyme activase [Desulfosalsimonas propionicica]|uniref:Putative CoA-substrate-specific enzyme activase n=1 Tax=Desulfosalsimonas propionicica TaxID=332175 RepID=A0A7W0C704_9BACT|nr:acyl-CoA dehydratase activase [Desulfosalsimonas propionicica]MBA2880210.1 putative CoA-substrate-specific enzyme activase [Desulfosalsimonas propionicica]